MNVAMIVTVYNRMEHFKTILKSIINQSHQINQLIIADDGSQESVEETIKEFLPQINFEVLHVYQSDLGFRLSKSRNNGAHAAKDGLLIFADQDIIFGNDFVKDIVSQAKKGCIHPHKVLWSTYHEKMEIFKKMENDEPYKNFISLINSQEISNRKKQNFKDYIRAFKFRFNLRQKPLTVGGASFSIFKEDFIKINGFDETFKGHGSEDLDFGYRAQAFGIKPSIVLFKEAPIHLNHAKDPTAGSNQKKIEKLKTDRKNIPSYAEYGYNSPLESDEVTITYLKKI